MERIDTFQDLLDILDAHPEWTQALREKLLVPELLALPERFAQFTNIMDLRFTALQRDLLWLKEFALLEHAERKYGLIAHTANVREPRLLKDFKIVAIADEAYDEGLANIPENEWNGFRAIDLAMVAMDKASGEPCYVVVECSYTLTLDVIVRTHRNAQVMTRFTGLPAKSVAVGSDSISETVARLAQDLQVTCVTLRPK